MRFGFDRTTLIFVIFVIIIAAIFGIQRFVQNQPPITIEIAVDPLAEDWVKAAASAYNDTSPLVNGTVRVQVSVTVKNDLDVWRGNPDWNSAAHPVGWIPSSSLSLDLAPPSLPFQSVKPSLARTPLMWGGFETRVNVITAAGTRPFDWSAVQEIAAAQRWDNLGESGGNINMAIDWPTSSMSGIGSLLSASATYSSSAAVSRSMLDDSGFTAWFQPIYDSVLNSQRLGRSPAEEMASRGMTVADYALLPESEWLQSLNDLSDDGIVLAYPAYQFILNFPLVLWSDAQTTSDQRAALNSFGDFLLGQQGQSLAVANGLRPAVGEPDAGARLFANGQANGIQLIPDYGQVLQPPHRDVVEALIELVN